MKVRFLILLIPVLFLSCPQKVDLEDEPQTETINGSWDLKRVFGGFMPVDIDYNIGDVKWTFNENEGNVVIENNVLTTGPEDIHAGLDSGTYSYQVQLINDEQKLYIDGVEIGVIILEGDNLDIDNGLALDGYVSQYER